MEEAHAVGNMGHEPIAVTPVEYSVWFPTKITGSLKGYDFALRDTQDRSIIDTNEVSQQGPTPYMTVLSIDKRGNSQPPHSINLPRFPSRMTRVKSTHRLRPSR